MRRITMLLTAGAAVVAGAGALAATGPAATTSPVQRLTITIATGDQEAVPANFAVSPGSPVVIRFRNETHAFHTFTIPALGVSVLIRPAHGDAARVTTLRFTAPRSGVFAWRCVICAGGSHAHMHAMYGRIYAIVGASR